jgi:hypothetical protein
MELVQTSLVQLQIDSARYVTTDKQQKFETEVKGPALLSPTRQVNSEEPLNICLQTTSCMSRNPHSSL